MSILTQEKYQRQRMVKYAKKHSVTETAIRYKVSRKTVYKWLERYDGTIDSLLDRSIDQKTHQNPHNARGSKAPVSELQHHISFSLIHPEVLLVSSGMDKNILKLTVEKL